MAYQHNGIFYQGFGDHNISSIRSGIVYTSNNSPPTRVTTTHSDRVTVTETWSTGAKQITDTFNDGRVRVKKIECTGASKTVDTFNDGRIKVSKRACTGVTKILETFSDGSSTKTKKSIVGRVTTVNTTAHGQVTKTDSFSDGQNAHENTFSIGRNAFHNISATGDASVHIGSMYSDGHSFSGFSVSGGGRIFLGNMSSSEAVSFLDSNNNRPYMSSRNRQWSSTQAPRVTGTESDSDTRSSANMLINGHLLNLTQDDDLPPPYEPSAASTSTVGSSSLPVAFLTGPLTSAQNITDIALEGPTIDSP